MSDRRSCISCGQPIPPTAKLSERVLTRAQIAALQGEEPGPEAQDQIAVSVCLQCQIRLSRVEVA